MFSYEFKYIFNNLKHFLIWLLSDSQIDLPNKRLTPASVVTVQTQQPVHNTNLLADVTNTNDLLQRNARTQRLSVLRQKRKVSAIDNIRTTPTKRTTQKSSNTVLTDGQLISANNETQSMYPNNV